MPEREHDPERRTPIAPTITDVEQGTPGARGSGGLSPPISY
jgi:hypothetical protein